MRTVSFQMSDDLVERLSRLAERRHESRSALMREAIEEFVRLQQENEIEATVESALERAGNLVGSIQGPPNLSSCEPHMDGYGV